MNPECLLDSPFCCNFLQWFQSRILNRENHTEIYSSRLTNFLSDSYHLIELEAPIPPSSSSKRLGMAQGIPRSFFHSAIPQGINFITPRILKVLTKIPWGPRKYSLQISKENLKGVINKRNWQKSAIYFQKLYRI